GNIFTYNAHGVGTNVLPQYYCAGPQVKTSPPSGRLGSAQTSPPYVNAFGSQYAQCSGYTNATPADNPYSSEGYKAVSGWNYPVTVWRQDAATSSSGTGGSSGSSNSKMAPPPPAPTFGHGGFKDLDLF